MTAFGRTLTSVGHRAYLKAMIASQARVQRNIVAAIPLARIRWRYRLVADGLAVVLPTSALPSLAHVRGVAEVWPTVRYHSLGLNLTQGPQAIGADKLWGTTLATAGNGMKIGIIDDGVEATHPYLKATGFTYPSGFPKGQKKVATTKVIVQRTFAPAFPVYANATLPFDPSTPNGSFHATHVAGIAAGDHGTRDGRQKLSGVAPEAYIGNYKALTIQTPDFGLDGNSPEIAAAIEAAVADGMDVINLSLGEPEIEPSRDIVVSAIEAAAHAGVVPVVAAGNDFAQFGYGSISSPANAADAITVAATTESGTIASFSSAGPTPLSRQLKPDVSAPGVDITSSLPLDQGGPFGELGGTSMASPHVAGGAALLAERHPTWSVAQIKSALVQTAVPVHGEDGREVSVLREGGGLVDLARADDPLLFANPTGIAFAANGGTETVSLTDAGGGAGTWSVAVQVQNQTQGVTFVTDPTVSVPGELDLAATVGDQVASGDVTGFVVLSHASETRRIPFWVQVDHPSLLTEQTTALTVPGLHYGTTVGGDSLVSAYRYPSGGDIPYPGPESVYRVTLKRPVANFGVAVVSGQAVPHVVYEGDENHLTGYSGLPTYLNPYFSSFGEPRPIAGAILPLAGTYDVVFDTRSSAQAGAFEFRYWVDDTKPPVVRVVSARQGTIVVSVADVLSGVDPRSISASVDGRAVHAHLTDGRLTLVTRAGAHRIVVTASDYQEAKNTEDVGRIRPNTTKLVRTVTVR